MKTAISLPDDLFINAEKLSRRKHMSRSELYATAIRWYIEKESGISITEQLNKVYRNQADYDKVVENAGLSDLPKETW